MKRRYGKPLIVAVGGQKGGVGKTTIAVSLAIEWMSRGARVALVDTDPQKTVIKWSQVADAREVATPTVVWMPPSLGKPQQLPAFAEAFDVTVIDLPPRLEAEIRGALMVADLVVLPCGPSGPDAWAMAETLELVKRAQMLRSAVSAHLVVNRKDPRTTLGRDARGVLEATGFPVLATELCQRIAYAESLTGGMGPSTYDPEGAAAGEVRALVDELEALRA